MTTFESKVSIQQSVNVVYEFLVDMNNHQKLMPENIQDWSSTYDTASFNIQNMAKLNLIVESRIQDNEIRIIATEKPPFDLELKWTLLSDNDNTEVLFIINANLNMMLKMLASGPLQKLADHETETLFSLLS